MSRNITDGYMLLEETDRGTLKNCRIVESETKDFQSCVLGRSWIEGKARELAAKSPNRFIIMKVVAYVDGPETTPPPVKVTEVK